MHSSRKFFFGVVVALFVAGLVAAQDIPVRNWEVPRGDLAKNAVVPPNPFAAISPPCRLNDSRVTSGGPGPIPGSGTRDYDFIPGGSPACGALPANVVALSLYFTVVGPLGPGFLFAYPTGSPPGSPTSIINYNGTPGELRNNAAIVPVDPATGSFTVGIGVSGTDLIIDINGIFYNDLTPPQRLVIISDSPGEATILGANRSTAPGSHAIGGFADGGMVHGVEGQIGQGALSGSSGVRGINGSTASGTSGVRGLVTSTAGVPDSAGVRGINAGATDGYGVWGSHNGFGVGVYGISDSAIGVLGVSSGTSGPNSIGVRGVTLSSASGAAGVEGRDNSGPVAAGVLSSAGVRGLSELGAGVLGITDDPVGEGVLGILNDSAGNFVTGGVLGYSASSGVHFFNGLTGTGTKSFVEPHPTDASKLIKYVSLEGNEAGTYFRGRSRFERGMARIAVPEDFRMVTDPESLSVQVTPIGEMTTFAVVRIDLNEIVVKGSRNVEFFYLVQGVRRAYRGWNPVWPNQKEFVPESENSKLPAYLSEDERNRLVSNGTYNPDGTVNLETAKRLGWDKTWAKKKAAPPAE